MYECMYKYMDKVRFGYLLQDVGRMNHEVNWTILPEIEISSTAHQPTMALQVNTCTCTEVIKWEGLLYFIYIYHMLSRLGVI